MEKQKLAVAFAVPVAALGAAAAMAIAAATTVSTGKTSLGTVLTSSNGHTLYLYEGDSGKHLGCAGKCLGFWPPVPAPSGKASASGGAKASLLGSVSRGSTKQLTYKGHPLYWFYKDKKAGQTNGQGLILNGKYWYAVSTSGAAMIASAKSTTSSSGGSTSTSTGW